MMARIGLLLLTLGTAAFAQTSSGYVFFAPGGASSGNTTMALHIGAGADVHIAKGLGANVEIGALGSRNNFSDSLFGVLSTGATFKFLRGARKLEPFVAGGHSLAFRSGHAHLVYFGGGANYWFTERVGMRLEFRDHVSTDDAWHTRVHFWGFRMGLALR